ncbi:hypothetical protein SteCoe_3427 [Stentor coeruleus]|uniref:Uncharacterized protein n=1 Tax=Stentor coeruleus TaxID=5963 RepID=A0A1R2CX53_9CILI|nr:hypothetical protein SteCoe_3427 [Stentor coeruleus]
MGCSIGKKDEKGEQQTGFFSTDSHGKYPLVLHLKTTTVIKKVKGLFIISEVPSSEEYSHSQSERSNQNVCNENLSQLRYSNWSS